MRHGNMYEPIEKVQFLADIAGGFTEREIFLVQVVCPELISVDPRNPRWRSGSRPWEQGSPSERRRTYPLAPGWRELLSDLHRYLGRSPDAAGPVSGHGPCGGDGFGDTHSIPPSPSMVDYLVALIPQLETQAREIYRKQVLEEPRKHSDPPKPKRMIRKEEAIAWVSFGGFDAEGAFGELIWCVLQYEERWRPRFYNELLRDMGAGYGKVREAMVRPDLTFDQVRAILVSFARFASRQSANPAYFTSGRLQRLLERLRELREAEECPLLKPRKGGMGDDNG